MTNKYLLELGKQFSYELTDEDKLRLVVELGEELEELPMDRRTAETKVEGCMSNTYIEGRVDEEGKMSYRGASDSAVVRGFLAILIQAFSGEKARNVVVEMREEMKEFLAATGVNANLLPTRSNALGRVVEMMVEKAKVK